MKHGVYIYVILKLNLIIYATESSWQDPQHNFFNQRSSKDEGSQVGRQEKWKHTTEDLNETKQEVMEQNNITQS